MWGWWWAKPCRDHFPVWRPAQDSISGGYRDGQSWELREYQIPQQDAEMCCTVPFSSVAESCLTLCDPQASLSITNSQSSPKLLPIESVMKSSHLILCHPLLLLPPLPPSIRAFSNESTLVNFVKLWLCARLEALHVISHNHSISYYFSHL